MWYKHYGFEKNPLDIRPNDNVIGMDLVEQEIIHSIESEEIFLVYGPIGAGKTSLALKIMKKLGNKYKFIYLNGEEDPNPNVKKIFYENYERKIFFMRVKEKKPIVFILDEFQNFNEEVPKFIKALYDSRKIYAVMIIQVSEHLANVTPSFLNRLHKKIFVDFPDEKVIIEIIKQRLKDRIKINENFLINLIRKNNRNVRKILIELNSILERLRHPIKELNYDIMVEEQDTQEEKLSVRVSPQQAKILEKLIGNELTIKEISKLTGISYNTVSKQVSRLYEKGILLRKEERKKVKYYINPKYLKEIIKIIGK